MRLFWPFLPKFGQNEFSWKKGSVSFPIIYHRAKNQKKLICNSWGKCWTDRWMDRQMEGQADIHDFVGPSLGRGPSFEVTLSFRGFISKRQKPIYSINFFLWDTANFRFMQPEWAHPLMTTPIPKFFNQLFFSMYLYQHGKS